MSQEKNRILIAEDDEHFSDLIRCYLAAQDDFEVMAVCNDGNDAFDKITMLRPEIVIINYLMQGNGGVELLNKLSEYSRDIGAFNLPICIITSMIYDERLVQLTHQLGAASFMTRSFEPEDLARRIRQHLKEKTEKVLEENKTRNLPTQIINILHKIGVPSHCKGYDCIQEAIILCANDMELLNDVTQRLYPAVAEKCSSTPARVERNIRHAIEAAWGRGEKEAIETLFGCTLNSHTGRPSNSEFISLIANKLT